MANSRLCLRFTLPLMCAFLFITHSVKCDIYAEEEDSLVQDINSYRVSLNLTALRMNDNAKCVANELVGQMKGQSCANTEPKTAPQLASFADILTKCHLNVANTRDGSIVPVCAEKLDANLFLSNFIKSPYSGDLKDTRYVGVGVGLEDNWAVVVLTTNTPAGNFMTSKPNTNSVSRIGAASFHLFLLMSFLHIFN